MPTASTSCGTDDHVQPAEYQLDSSPPTQPEVLNELLLRMTRAVLQHPEVERLYENPGSTHNKLTIYRILEDYFTNAQGRRKRAVALQLSQSDLKTIIELCAGEALSAVYMASGAAVLCSAATAAEFIARAPILPLESVRSRLTRHGTFMLAPSLAQLLELSRRVDKALAQRTPQGGINCTHLAALACTLYPTVTLAELVLTVAHLWLVDWPRRVSSGPVADDAVVWLAVHMLDAVWAEWGLLDTAYQPTWQRLAGILDASAHTRQATQALPAAHLDNLFAALTQAVQEDPLLKMTLARGPDALVSLDPAMRSLRGSVDEGHTQRTSAAADSPQEVSLSNATLHEDSYDGNDGDTAVSEDEETGINERFWRDLAS